MDENNNKGNQLRVKIYILQYIEFFEWFCLHDFKCLSWGNTIECLNEIVLGEEITWFTGRMS